MGGIPGGVIIGDGVDFETVGGCGMFFKPSAAGIVELLEGGSEVLGGWGGGEDGGGGDCRVIDGGGRFCGGGGDCKVFDGGGGFWRGGV